MRQSLLAGNWKMHGSRDSVAALLGALGSSVKAETVDVAVCPTFVHLAQALELCAGSRIAVGAQDCSHVVEGAYTGEVAAAMLAELGCQWVILGHSERRAYHSESDELVSAKLRAVIEAGLAPILCVGETREQREAGAAQSVVAAQLSGALDSQQDLSGLVVAYGTMTTVLMCDKGAKHRHSHTAAARTQHTSLNSRQASHYYHQRAQ